MVILENEYISTHIQPLGAELTKIYSKQTNIDYLWSGDASFWKRHAPILFPIVGKLINNSYLVNEKKYTLPQHGFARDLVFTVTHQNAHSVVFELQHTEETLAVYPYKFTLQISYELNKNQLLVSYTVINTDDSSIYFSIGAHPAFNCPLVTNTNFDDYYIEFEVDENPTQHFLNPKTGFRTSQTKKVSLGKQIQLSYDLFDNDAIMFEGIQSSTVSLKSHQHNHGIHMHIPNWKYLAFWTQKGQAPFICFEPWMGIADQEDTNQVYKTKTGVQKLEVATTHTNKYILEFF